MKLAGGRHDVGEIVIFPISQTVGAVGHIVEGFPLTTPSTHHTDAHQGCKLLSRQRRIRSEVRVG
jgi:hypothetical protein